MQLKVQISRYVEDYFPGIVECELIDAEGHLHKFIEKVPVVCEKWLPQDSYPMDGAIRCEILEQWFDADGRDLVRVSTEHPDYVETTEGTMNFVVLSSQVVSAEETILETERKAKACEDRARLEPNRADALLREAASHRQWIENLRHGHWRP